MPLDCPKLVDEWRWRVLVLVRTLAGFEGIAELANRFEPVAGLLLFRVGALGEVAVGWHLQPPYGAAPALIVIVAGRVYSLPGAVNSPRSQ